MCHYCVPPCFTAFSDVDGSESVATHTALGKFVVQLSSGRQRVHSMQGNGMPAVGRVQ